ncbi:PF06166 family protein [Lachnoanaerobaculum saburreum F0468]|jgi:hypothetical protein|uniref:PF06166 family protein n=1 Tax=Lachnoanaerobaculum saburreum F0468 TaxID=1095750 RepID=I0R3S2_9FIRM|nr:DUF979 domain-containing protein [Lachnoanaerobaculum saburreum]EIC94330.1 PF06166 family protein [Lachnoanaerobaculum saburreum F0468]RKW54927.1 MAG: DUF979 domain-containing protein [Lachnospiraceae bacterium]
MDSVLKLSEIATWGMSKVVAEIFFIIIGIVFILVGLKALADKQFTNSKTSALFWFIVAFTFIAGPYVPKFITGLCVVLMALLTAVGKVGQSASDVPTATETRANADKLGNKIFIAPLVLALSAWIIATVWKKLGANNAVGLSAMIALIVVFMVTGSKKEYAIKDGTRLMDNIGPVGLLPQVLAALGALFTAAGVGDVIAKGIEMVIPHNNRLIAVIVYCLAMALFTAIMGNGFAAFSVITVGIGIPFLINQGANPLVVGAMGLTAGYCGTLMTPMAANFNIMPAALLETKNKYGIIKMQLPYAIAMLIAHIILMYICAFR